MVFDATVCLTSHQKKNKKKNTTHKALLPFEVAEGSFDV